MKIDSMMAATDDDIFFKKEFFDVLSAHLEFLRAHPDTKVVAIDKEKAHPHYGDFYRYLLQIGVSVKYHWIIMRVNSMLHPSEFTPDKLMLYLPSEGIISKIRILQQYSQEGLIA